MKVGIRKAGNAGLVTTGGPGVNDLCHDLVLVANVTNPRTAIIKKIMAYNNAGANATLRFGTLDRQAVPAFVPLLPPLYLINTFDAEWTEDEIPAVEFASNIGLLAAGRNGSIYVLCSAIGVLVSIEVEEFGA